MLVKEKYPDGYEDNLITFQSPSGELETGLPLETKDIYYLIKMPKSSLPDDEDDFDQSESVTDEFESLENLEIADDEESDED